ncbi:MAG: hypothetical protein CVU84_11785 [Firmicutes bacterium HGW-Firmicutes-1]|jgi:spore maturation protein CgeB|nr:MAG: hypothetical protein CVU84_11785 [Firmicutes bacterium HGW-Firmicutes-1]
MRIIFIENDHRFIFGLPLGFRDAGHSILVTGTFLESRLNFLFASFKPHFAVVLGWSLIHTKSNLELIHEVAHIYNVPLVYWATEDPTFTTLFSIPLIKLLSPNWVFTVSPSSVPIYRSFGYGASFLPFGYQPTIFHPKSRRNINNRLVGLVANAYPNVLEYDTTHYRKSSMNILLSPLLDKDVQVDIWGDNWDKMTPILDKELPSTWLHGSIHYLKTNDVYNSCDIVLGLQNYSDDVITMRTFEILGAGGFLMTSYNKALEHFLNHGKDFIMVNSYEDMLEKYNFYMENEPAKELIRTTGSKSISMHSYKERALYIISDLEKEKIISSNL